MHSGDARAPRDESRVHRAAQISRHSDRQIQPRINSVRNWTIGKRIIAGNSALVALLLIVGGVAFTAFSRLEQFAGARLRDDAIPGIVESGEMSVALLRSYIRVAQISATTDAARREQFITRFEVDTKTVADAMGKYEDAITSVEDRRN